MFMSLWATRLILKALGVSDFGLYNTIGWAIGMLSFINASMAGVTQRYMSYYQGAGDHEKCHEIYNVSLVIHFVLALLFVGSLIVVGYFFFNGILNIPPDRIDAAKIIYAALTISTAFTVMSVPYEAIITAHEDMRFYGIEGVLRSFLKLLAAVAILYVDSDKLVFYGILMAVISVIDMVVLRYYCQYAYDECVFSLSRYWNKSTAAAMAKFASWNFFITSSNFVCNYGSVLTLNHFFGVVMNASAGIASQFGGAIQTFSSSMRKALDPAITKSEGAGNREKMLRFSSSGCKFTFASFAILAIPMYIEMPLVLHLWLGEYPEWAVLFSRLILIWTLIYIATSPYDQSLMSEGEISGYSLMTSILNILTLALLVFLFINGFPPVTMYILDIVVLGVLQSIVRVVYTHHKCGLSYKSFIIEVLIPILISLIVAFGISIIPSIIMAEGYIRLFITMMVSTVSYSLLFWACATDMSEKAAIRSVVSSIRRRLT